MDKEKKKIAEKIRKILIKNYDLDLDLKQLKIYLDIIPQDKDINVMVEKIYDIAISLENESLE